MIKAKRLKEENIQDIYNICKNNKPIINIINKIQLLKI